MTGRNTLNSNTVMAQVCSENVCCTCARNSFFNIASYMDAVIMTASIIIIRILGILVLIIRALIIIPESKANVWTPA